MTHQIVFENAENHWNTALPLGNGRMGAMVFFHGNALHIALNHYDCYYPILSRYAKERKQSTPKTYEELRALVNEARTNGDFSRSHYIHTLNPAATDRRPSYKTTSVPMAGEIILPLSPEINLTDFSLRLLIEEGTVIFQAKDRHCEISAVIWVSKTEDCLFVRMSQSEPGIWGEANLVIPSEHGLSKTSVSRGRDKNIHWLRTSFRPETELNTENIITIETALNITENCLTASVGLDSVIERTKKLSSQYEHLQSEHTASWKSFWRSTVELPDKFLETLWYLHIYTIGCASGFRSLYPEQACGLNGLWDIRRPTLWGSMWYWDVNIQEVFWPVFSSNHLELGKLFFDGYVKYADDAVRFAETVYGADGWAIDYPHTLYNCIQPWCAQFLWQYYRYSGDIDFLRDKAYPVFQKQIHFLEQTAYWDEHGILHIDPDISPEQGPITRDSVISVASVKQLLKYAIQTTEILGRPAEEAERYRRLINALPEYARTSDGKRWKDSELAPDDLFLRHPSVLMPIFPAEEVSRNSSKEIRDLARNTLQYVSGHTETGVFGFGWIACAAARLGEGTAALRLLYEEGLDYILHANGLGYEESERFINYCHVTKPPLYPPAMTEPSGGIVMAVNMMLIQADEAIEVFPALPDGHDGLRETKAEYGHQETYLQGHYPAWDNCRFAGLLAPGGFIVSAERKNGKTRWIQVTATRDETLRLLLPGELSPSNAQICHTQKMKQGETISFGVPSGGKCEDSMSVQVREAAFTHRRIYLGANRHTEFHKAVDSFTCAYRMGNSFRYPMTKYVFDFGDTAVPKSYDNVYHKQFCQIGRSLLFFAGPKRVGIHKYDGDIGYGFASAKGLALKFRELPDDLRMDFIEGVTGNEFWIELPRGQYNLLVVSGDEEDKSITHINLPHCNGRITGAKLLAGRYQRRTIPFVHEHDGVFKIGFSTEVGYKWKLNALFLNKETTYC